MINKFYTTLVLIAVVINEIDMCNDFLEFIQKVVQFEKTKNPFVLCPPFDQMHYSMQEWTKGIYQNNFKFFRRFACFIINYKEENNENRN
jgi:hypothetical protein